MLDKIETNFKKIRKKRLDFFTSYTIVARDLSIFEKYQFRYLILDESQYIKIKNRKFLKL
jgi:non-specific serine/threonine protein kinase